MSDRPEEAREERRRTGPLGDDDDETRRVPTENGPEATRQNREEAGSSATRRVAQGPSEDNETRVIRTPEHPDTTRAAKPYPRGYFEEAEEREDRLRDMYGGVDWLASFLGFVFTLVVGAIFSAVAGLVLVPFGFPPDLSGERIGASVITGLAIFGVSARRDRRRRRQPGARGGVHGHRSGWRRHRRHRYRRRRPAPGAPR